jgi:transposase-like protein
MEDKVKIRCPACTRVFRERAGKVRDGVQLNCHNCNKLLTLNRDTEDPFFRRALRMAKEIRESREAQVFEAAYGQTK